MSITRLQQARQMYALGQRVKFQGGGRDASQPDFGGGSNQGGERDYHHQVHDYTPTPPAPTPTPREERVSPIESIARVGDISLAGKTKTEADREMAARNREEARTTPPTVKTIDEKIPDRIKNIITPPTVTPKNKRVPDQIKDIITPPAPKYGDEDIDAVYTDKSFTDYTDTTDYKDKINRGIFNIGLTGVSKHFGIANLHPAIAIANFISSIFDGPKVDPYSAVKSAFSGIKTTPKEGTGTTDTKERGEGRQFEQPTVQQAISKGEGLESGKKLLGLSEEETNYFNKIFASRDRKFLQSIFDKGTTRIQSGKATQKEKDVYTLLQQYLVDPKEGIMGVA